MKFKQMSVAEVYKLCGVVYPPREEEQKEIFQQCVCGELFVTDGKTRLCVECRREDIPNT